MGKKKRLQGGLIRKKQLTTGPEEYRVLSVDCKTNEITMLGTYPSLMDAKEEAKKFKKTGVDIYLHGDSNRVLAKV